MITQTLPATDAGIARAAALLRDGRLVAFGTETVYGLGARADDPDATRAIYDAKARPSFNPLICHYSSLAAAAADVVISPLAARLADQFWPGPLTLVLPRRPDARIAAPVSAGLHSLAIRVPAHPVALDLLARVGCPVAAPSANPSGRISPTTAAHVLDGLGGRIDAVLDSGPCAVGVESTVLDCTGPRPVLLRPGGIPRVALASIAGPLADPPPGIAASPGMSASHYAPLLPLRLHAAAALPGEALLAFGPTGDAPLVFQLSAGRDLAEAASRLFAGLRWLDATAPAQGLHALAAAPIPTQGLGAAINDRLARAACRDMAPP